MTTPPDDQSAFYAEPSPTSDLSRHTALLPGRVESIADASSSACNAVLHVAGVTSSMKLAGERFEDLNARSAARIVDRVIALKSDPLDVKRAPSERMIGNCYHIALLTCSLMRHFGVPARTRGGFASYLEAGRFTDHWVCEVRREGRWHRFDPDGRIDLDTDRRRSFMTGGEAWVACRDGRFDPELFGFEESRGWWFIRNNVVRDFAALCKVELLPWDFWGLMVGQDSDRPDELIDELSAMCGDDAAWRDRDERFASDPLVNPNGQVVVFRGGMTEVTLPTTW
jgi:hypothetical protein